MSRDHRSSREGPGRSFQWLQEVLAVLLKSVGVSDLQSVEAGAAWVM